MFAEKKIMCPFSGKVTGIKCKAGERVNEGQVVFELQALNHMDIEVAAPVSGSIERVLVREDESVEAGWTLAVIK